MSADSITITRHGDGAVLTYPFYWSSRAVHVGGYREMAPCPIVAPKARKARRKPAPSSTEPATF